MLLDVWVCRFNIVTYLVSSPLIDQQTYEVYYKKFYPAVISFFLKRGFPREDALEFTQDILFRVYTNRKQFQGTTEASFGAWLMTITTSSWKNILRDKGTFKRSGVTVPIDELMQHPSDNSPMADANPLGELMQEERVEPLRQAICNLKEPKRTCLILRVYHELKYNEIAAVLKVSLATVKNMLFQAREDIKEEMGGNQMEPPLS